MIIIQILLETIWNTFLLVVKTSLTVFPLYRTLSSLQQDIIAAALGISPLIAFLLIKSIKLFVKILKTM